MKDHWPQHRRMNPDGPWGGPIGEIVPETELPRSAQAILALAKMHHWGFGPISLAMRMNKEGFPPFYMVWEYDIDEGKWRFSNSRAANGQALNYRDCKVVIEHPDALLPQPPEE